MGGRSNSLFSFLPESLCIYANKSCDSLTWRAYTDNKFFVIPPYITLQKYKKQPQLHHTSSKKNNTINCVLHYPGRCAPHRRPGAVSVPYHSLYAQHSHNHFLYFYRAIRTANLELTAKTVRPTEKSFISAISRFQYPAQKKNMNDVKGQEMSENTLLSFSIFSKFTFLRFAEKLRGGWKKWPTSLNPSQLAGPIRLKKIPKKGSGHPHFWEKPTFFDKISKVDILTS